MIPFALLTVSLLALAAMSSRGRRRPAPVERALNGSPTATDLQAAADEAEQRGMTEEAATIREGIERVAPMDSAEQLATPPPDQGAIPVEAPTDVPSVDRLRNGEPTAIDLQAAANEAEQRGMVQEAATLRQAAENAAPAEEAPVAAPEETAPEETAPSSVLPPGFDPALARRLAQPFANHLRDKIAANNRYGYDRAKCLAFQRAAGIATDGLYGPATRGALQFYGVSNAPAAVFRPAGTPAVIAYPPELAQAASV